MVRFNSFKTFTFLVGYLKDTFRNSISTPFSTSGTDLKFFVLLKSFSTESLMLRILLDAAAAWAALGPKLKPLPAASAPLMTAK